MGKYVAMHIRKGDYQHVEIKNTPEDYIINKVKDDITDKDVLIVSDSLNTKLIEKMKKYCNNVVCWSGGENKYGKVSPIVDMICCVPAYKFFGTSLSTFSTGIMQWRGYLRANNHNEIDDSINFLQDTKFCVSCAGDVEPNCWRNLKV